MRFSVIVPCYNVEKYIVRCVESILAQVYEDFEVILVDDGSTDGTPGILDNYRSKNSKIKVIHKINGGSTSARKAGARAAQGDYVALVDGDDWISAEYLLFFSKVIDKFSVNVACCGYYEMLYSRRHKECHLNAVNGRYGYFKKREIEKYLLPQLFYFSPTLWSKVFERNLYLEYQLSLNERICMGEDGAVSYPILYNASKIFLIDRCLYYHRENPDSLTINPKNVVEWKDIELRVENFEKYILKNNYDMYSQFSEYVTKEIFFAAVTHLRNQKYRVAKQNICVFIRNKKYKDYLKSAFKGKRRNNRIKAVLLYFEMIPLLKVWVCLERFKCRYMY